MFTPELVATMVSDPAEEAVERGIWDGQDFGPVPPIVITWDDIRKRRDALLGASDKTALNDAPLTTEQANAWRIYRQALRDLPQTYATPAAVVWPEAPA